MALLLGIDLGTSYFKVGLFGADGALRGLGRVAVTTRAPAPGRSELPMEAFWSLLRQGLAEALAQAAARPDDITGISYSSQANTFVLLDDRDQPLTPLVIWTDRRAHPLEPGVGEFGRSDRFRTTAGFGGLAAEFAPVKWRWFQRHEPALWARAARVMTLSDYFTFALTGERVGDASTAALTGIYTPARGEWWTEALEFFGVHAAQLSRPLRPGAPAGRTARTAAVLGLPAGVPFAVGALDHHAAAIGSGLDRLADASISTGTVLAALGLVEKIEPLDDCYHGPHADGRRFYRLTFDPRGAGQLEEYQRGSAPHLSIEQLAALAASPESGNGADRQHGVAVRRLMEKISRSQQGLLQHLQAGPVKKVIATGGGARSTAWLQITADVLGATVIAPRSHERACLGAAAFAAVAAGVHRDLDAALAAMVHPDRVVTPRAVP